VIFSLGISKCCWISSQFSAIYFVHPLLFEINSQNGLEAVPNDLLPTNLNLDRFRFLFWSIPTKTKANDRWTTAVHSTHNNANIYWMDSWGSDEQIRAWVKTVFAYYKTSARFFSFCPQHVSFYQNIENTGIVRGVNYFVHLDNHPFEDMWMEEWMKIYVVMTWGVQELCSEVATKPRKILGLKNGSHKKWLSQKVESHWTTIESHFLGVRATGSQVTFPVWKPLPCKLGVCTLVE